MFSKKKIDIWSYAMLQAQTMFFIGLLFGVIYSVGGAIHDAFTIGFNPGTGLAFLALAGMPFIFTLAGYFFGLIGAAISNFFLAK